MNDTQWYIRSYRCDNGIEYKTKFPVRMTEKVRASYSRMRTEIRRAEKGAREARLAMGQELNCTYRVGHDRYMGFDLSDEGLEKIVQRAGSADRDTLYLALDEWFANCFVDKTLRRACKKAGVPLTYHWITSDMDGDTHMPVRPHVHMVINAEAAEIAAQLWKLGGVRNTKLYSHHHGDLQELADYMIGQVRSFAGKKRYHPSRNVKKPVCGKPVKARSAEAELVVPNGCEKIFRSEYHVGRPQHIRYWRPPEARPEFEDE